MRVMRTSGFLITTTWKPFPARLSTKQKRQTEAGLAAAERLPESLSASGLQCYKALLKGGLFRSGSGWIAEELRRISVTRHGVDLPLWTYSLDSGLEKAG